MIFHNPAGAPELACEQCGCRWFDRMTNTCYECGGSDAADGSGIQTGAGGFRRTQTGEKREHMSTNDLEKRWRARSATGSR
jgi:hypothetical protein